MSTSALQFANVGLEENCGSKTNIVKGTIVFHESHISFKNVKTEKVERRIKTCDIKNVDWYHYSPDNSVGIEISLKNDPAIHRFSGFHESAKDLIAPYIKIMKLKNLQKSERRMSDTQGHASGSGGNIDGGGDEGDDDEEDEVENSQQPLVIFEQVRGIVPRCHYEFEIFLSYLHLKGETKDRFDPKISKISIRKLFILPQNDGRNTYFVIGIDPPIQKGKSTYPYLVFSFPNSELTDIALSMTEKKLNRKFCGDLPKRQSGLTYELISNVVHAITGVPIFKPIVHYKNSDKDLYSIDCSYKATLGSLAFVKYGLIFVHTPTLYVPISDIRYFFLDVSSSTKNFCLVVHMRNGRVGKIEFSNIPKSLLLQLANFMIMSDYPLHDKERYVSEVRKSQKNENRRRSSSPRKRKGSSDSSDSECNPESASKSKSKKRKRSTNNKHSFVSNSDTESDSESDSIKSFVVPDHESESESSGSSSDSDEDRSYRKRVAGSDSDSSIEVVRDQDDRSSYSGRNSDRSSFSYRDPYSNDHFSHKYTRGAQPVVLLPRLEDFLEECHKTLEEEGTEVASIASAGSQSNSPKPSKSRNRQKERSEIKNKRKASKNTKHRSRGYISLTSSPQSPPRHTPSTWNHVIGSEVNKFLFTSGLSKKKSKKNSSTSRTRKQSSSSSNMEEPTASISRKPDLTRIGNPDNDSRLVKMRKRQEEAKKGLKVPKVASDLSRVSAPLPLSPSTSSAMPSSEKLKSSKKKRKKDRERNNRKYKRVSLDSSPDVHQDIYTSPVRMPASPPSPTATPVSDSYSPPPSNPLKTFPVSQTLAVKSKENYFSESKSSKKKSKADRVEGKTVSGESIPDVRPHNLKSPVRTSVSSTSPISPTTTPVSGSYSSPLMNLPTMSVSQTNIVKLEDHCFSKAKSSKLKAKADRVETVKDSSLPPVYSAGFSPVNQTQTSHVKLEEKYFPTSNQLSPKEKPDVITIFSSDSDSDVILDIISSSHGRTPPSAGCSTARSTTTVPPVVVKKEEEPFEWEEERRRSYLNSNVSSYLQEPPNQVQPAPPVIKQEIDVKIKVDPDDPGEVLGVELVRKPEVSDIKFPPSILTLNVKREVKYEYDASLDTPAHVPEPETIPQQTTSTEAAMGIPRIKIESEQEPVPFSSEPTADTARIKVEREFAEQQSNAERMRWIQNQPHLPPPPPIAIVKQEPGTQALLPATPSAASAPVSTAQISTPTSVSTPAPISIPASVSNPAQISTPTSVSTPAPISIPASVSNTAQISTPVSISNPVSSLIPASVSNPAKISTPAKVLTPFEHLLPSIDTNLVSRPSSEAMKLRQNLKNLKNNWNFNWAKPPRSRSRSSKYNPNSKPRARPSSRNCALRENICYFWYWPRPIDFGPGYNAPTPVRMSERANAFCSLPSDPRASSRFVTPRPPPPEVNRRQLQTTVVLSSINDQILCSSSDNSGGAVEKLKNSTEQDKQQGERSTSLQSLCHKNVGQDKPEKVPLLLTPSTAFPTIIPNHNREPQTQSRWNSNQQVNASSVSYQSSTSALSSNIRTTTKPISYDASSRNRIRNRGPVAVAAVLPVQNSERVSKSTELSKVTERAEKLQVTILNERYGTLPAELNNKTKDLPTPTPPDIKSVVFEIPNDKFQRNTKSQSDLKSNVKLISPLSGAGASATVTRKPSISNESIPETSSSSNSVAARKNQKQETKQPTAAKTPKSPVRSMHTLVPVKVKNYTMDNPYGLVLNVGFPKYGSGRLNLQGGRFVTFLSQWDLTRTKKVCTKDSENQSVFYPIGPCLELADPCVVCYACRTLGHRSFQCPFELQKQDQNPNQMQGNFLPGNGRGQYSYGWQQGPGPSGPPGNPWMQSIVSPPWAMGMNYPNQGNFNSFNENQSTYMGGPPLHQNQGNYGPGNFGNNNFGPSSPNGGNYYYGNNQPYGC